MLCVRALVRALNDAKKLCAARMRNAIQRNHLNCMRMMYYSVSDTDNSEKENLSAPIRSQTYNLLITKVGCSTTELQETCGS